MPPVLLAAMLPPRTRPPSPAAPWSDQRPSPFPCILGRDRLAASAGGMTDAAARLNHVAWWRGGVAGSGAGAAACGKIGRSAIARHRGDTSNICGYLQQGEMLSCITAKMTAVAVHGRGSL